MAIPEAKLETWSHPGAQATAKATHEAIRSILTPAALNLSQDAFNIYLQGSYANHTNVRGDSDVDIVAELFRSFQYDITILSPSQQQLFHDTFPNAAYLLTDFRSAILSCLRRALGANMVTEGGKCLKVASGNGRLAADILVCQTYRTYTSFRAPTTPPAVEGVTFYTSDGRWVVNYPKQHLDNGESKNQATSEWFKPTVRVFKNARSELEERRLVDTGSAPSYFLQCLLYNVPNSKFGRSFQTSFCEIVNWLSSNDLSHSICQNDITPLFGNTPEQWSLQAACAIVRAYVRLWNEWI
jgi:hypothetical protein